MSRSSLIFRAHVNLMKNNDFDTKGFLKKKKKNRISLYLYIFNFFLSFLNTCCFQLLERNVF